ANEMRALHIPVRLLALRLKVDAVGESMIQQLDCARACFRRQWILRRIEKRPFGRLLRQTANTACIAIRLARARPIALLLRSHSPPPLLRFVSFSDDIETVPRGNIPAVKRGFVTVPSRSSAAVRWKARTARRPLARRRRTGRYEVYARTPRATRSRVSN